MSFGGQEPGKAQLLLTYNKERVPAFVMALGNVTDEWAANAAGAINFGFPIISDASIPEIPPVIISNIPHNKIVSRAIESRGIKINVTEVPIPVAFGAAFEGERIRKGDGTWNVVAAIRQWWNGLPPNQCMR